MKFSLRKVTKTPLEFEVKSDEVTFKGYLEYHSGKLISLHATLKGSLPKDCDICAEEFVLSVDEEINFFISDGVFNAEAPLDFDVVESLDGNADIEELLHSEIELIKSDYHACESCALREDEIFS